MRFTSSIVLGLTVALLAPAAFAAKKPASSPWLTLADEANGRLELDRSRVGHGAKGEVQAWSRLSLNGEMPDASGLGRYTAIEALNSYDCSGKRYATLKRVYLRKGAVLREERITAPRTIDTVADSLDALLLGTVCKAQTFAHAKTIIEPAAGSADKPSKPGAMYADMRTLVDSGKPQMVAVSDTTDSKTDSKSGAKDKSATTPATGEKPAGSAPKRFVELPKVDKSQLEDPNKPADGKEGKGRGLSASDRLTIEQQLAASGPRKPKPKKKKAKPAAKPENAETKPAQSEHEVHWSYEGEGAPANWSKLSAANALCATGKRQSPIDIRDGIHVDLEPIKFDYQNAQFTVVDNGHTIQVNIGEGNTLTVMGRTYQLVQFHFHRPSEERINGRSYEMVAHFVHKDMEGRIAVVAVLFERGPLENPQIQTVWNNLPLEVGQTVSPAAVLDLSKLLPTTRDYWTYMGSLTTPPCSEDVLWMVMKQPIQVSGDQIAIFSRLYKNNARPVQPSNGRLIKESR